MSILVTGGAGFIGSNFINNWCSLKDETIINLDKLTYSGNTNNFETKPNNKNHIFIKGNIINKDLLGTLFKKYNPRAIINFAAESHVDRSIHSPKDFIDTNIMGTFNLLECSKNYWKSLNPISQKSFRFLQISTDEVYGTLMPSEPAFNENNPYKPNSPYSASKAASDHLVRSYFHTYGLPTLTTNCSNNYGPYQFPEKLIPLIIHNALTKKPLPIYGDGKQIRDWLYVLDHCSAINEVLAKGKIGEVYNVGGLNEKTNIDIVHSICDQLDILRPSNEEKKFSYRSLITFVKDRPGHDRRYAINANKINKELNWFPKETFETGILKTIEWYLNNIEWVNQVASGDYQKWIKKQY